MATVAAPPEERSFTRRERAILEERLWRAIAADPIRWLGVAQTLDEHAPEGEPAIRPFPLCPRCAADPHANADVVLSGDPPRQVAACRAHGRRHKPYFAPLAAQWQREEIILGEKSRQLMISWFYVELCGWRALTRAGRKIAFQSMNYDKACELVDRFAMSYQALPQELQRFWSLSDSPKALARKVEGRLVFRHPEGPSEIFAIPNGKHQTRMYTFTEILMDECQFWEPDEEFEESYAAAIPTIKGGGRLVAISSVGSAQSYHFRLVRGFV